MRLLLKRGQAAWLAFDTANFKWRGMYFTIEDEVLAEERNFLKRMFGLR